MTDITILPLDPASVRTPGDTFSFGREFTNRMFTQSYNPQQGWHDATIGPYRNFSLSPATIVFHYAQEIFEGLKAYRRPDGRVNLFRPIENMKRFNRSAERMCMATLDPEAHLDALVRLIDLERDWVPSKEGSSLYIRPTLIATDPFIGVQASLTYLHYIILSPVGAYFAQGFRPVPVYISDSYVRAVRGGTGAAKTGGNYAASLYVSEQVKAQGYSQVLWLDAVERRYVEEVGAMNIAFVYNGNHIVTPQLTDSILPGVTRASVVQMAPDLGYTVSEERLELERVLADIASGEITEAFGMGTAVVIAPVDRFGYRDKVHTLRSGEEAGPVAGRLYQALTDIQYGRSADPYGWTITV
jgi:branched-chain amino acid aminotransferase